MEMEGSEKLVEQQSEVLSCGTGIQRGVPVPPPSRKKKPLPSLKDLKGELKELQIEEKTLMKELDKWGVKERNLAEERRLSEPTAVPIRRKGFEVDRANDGRSDLFKSDCSSGIDCELVSTRQTMLALLGSLEGNSRKQQEIRRGIQQRIRKSSSLDDVGRKQKIKLGRGKSLLEERVTGLEAQKLPKDMANKLDILDEGGEADILDGGGDAERVDILDRGKSAMAVQLPIVDSKLTSELKAEAVIVPETKKDMEGESGKLMEQQSKVLSCGPEVQIHDEDGDADDNEEVDMERSKSLFEQQTIGPSPHEMVMEQEFLSQVLSELRSYLKSKVLGPKNAEMQSLCVMLTEDIRQLHLLLKRSYAEAGDEMLNWTRRGSSPREKMKRKSRKQQQQPLQQASQQDKQNRRDRDSSKERTEEEEVWMDDIGKSLLFLEEQAKMEGESVSKKQQQSQVVSCGPVTHQPPCSNKGKHGAHATAHSGRPQHDSAMEEQVLRIQDSKLRLQDHASTVDDDKKEDIINRGKSAQQIANEEEEMVYEKEKLASYREYWKSFWGPSRGSFLDMTTVSPMHFTHRTPGCGLAKAAIFGATFQIFTLKLAEIKGGLEWPLFVYGVVAVRDDVDHNRNLLFSCNRNGSQKLDQDDPFLHLIGPSRAILFTDHVDIEIQLRVKGTTVSQDRALISASYHYTEGHYPGVSTICFKNCFCTTELCMERVERTVQATIMSVRVKNGPWPFKYGGQLACFSQPESKKGTSNTDQTSMDVVLLDSRGGPMPKGAHGYLRLSRQVVSVNMEGSLKIFIRAYSPSGEIASQGELCFKPKDCNITRKACFFGDPKVEVEITVAWSPLVSAKQLIEEKGWKFELYQNLERRKRMEGF